MRRQPVAAALVLVVATLLASCGGAVDDSYVVKDEPGHVEHVEGSDIARVSITEDAARRLDVQVDTVEVNGHHRTVPREAIFVDPHGVWWVYTTEEPLVFVREQVELVEERDGVAYLSSGPEAGTEVVTIGVAELAYIEEGLDH